MPDWRIKLAGEKDDLQDLTSQLTGLNWRVEEQSGEYYLRSSDLDALHDAHKALARAEEFVSVVRGIVRVLFNRDLTVTIAGVLNNPEGGSGTSDLIGRQGIPSAEAFGMGGSVRTSGEPLPSASILAVRIARAERDPKIVKAFRIYGSCEHTWDNLYKIFEVVESDVGGKITELGGITNAEINRFTQTANSAQAIGDAARHGHEKNPPPKTPMTLPKAQALIRNLLDHWLRR